LKALWPGGQDLGAEFLKKVHQLIPTLPQDSPWAFFLGKQGILAVPMKAITTAGYKLEECFLLFSVERGRIETITIEGSLKFSFLPEQFSLSVRVCSKPNEADLQITNIPPLSKLFDALLREGSKTSL